MVSALAFAQDNTGEPVRTIALPWGSWDEYWSDVDFDYFQDSDNWPRVTITSGEEEGGGGPVVSSLFSDVSTKGEKEKIQYYCSEKELTIQELHELDPKAWVDYDNPFDLEPHTKQIIYAKFTDPSEPERVRYINSASIVCYKNSYVRTKVSGFNHWQSSSSSIGAIEGSLDIKVKLNGNTIRKVVCSDGIFEEELRRGTDF